MRAVKDSPTTPLGEKVRWCREGNKRPSPGRMARLGVTVGGRVRKLRAVEDQSVPIPEEITSKLGGKLTLYSKDGGSTIAPMRK